MEITTNSVDGVTVVSLSGEIDGKTAPLAQEYIVPLCQPGSKVLLDMRNVTYMSSAGLRLMLSIYRQMSAAKGKLVLVGLSDELKDTMSATGFLEHFTLSDTLDAGTAVLS